MAHEFRVMQAVVDKATGIVGVIDSVDVLDPEGWVYYVYFGSSDVPHNKRHTFQYRADQLADALAYYASGEIEQTPQHKVWQRLIDMLNAGKLDNFTVYTIRTEPHDKFVLSVGRRRRSGVERILFWHDVEVLEFLEELTNE